MKNFLPKSKISALLLVSCVFILLTAFSCLKFPELEEGMEFYNPRPHTVTTPSLPVATNPQNPVVVQDDVLSQVNIQGSLPALTAEDDAGNPIPILKEGDVVSASNVPNGSPTEKTSGDFLVVVVKGDGSGYVVTLIKPTRDAVNGGVNIGWWLDGNGMPIILGITMGKKSGGLVDDGKIYLSNAYVYGNPRVIIPGTIDGVDYDLKYVLDEEKGQIDTGASTHITDVMWVGTDSNWFLLSTQGVNTKFEAIDSNGDFAGTFSQSGDRVVISSAVGSQGMYFSTPKGEVRILLNPTIKNILVIGDLLSADLEGSDGSDQGHIVYRGAR